VETKGTSPNNKPGIISRDNETGTCMLLKAAVAGQKWDQERSWVDSKV